MHIAIAVGVVVLVAEVAGLVWLATWLLGTSPSWILVTLCAIPALLIVITVLCSVAVAAEDDAAFERRISERSGAYPLPDDALPHSRPETALAPSRKNRSDERGISLPVLPKFDALGFRRVRFMPAKHVHWAGGGIRR